MLRIDKDKIAQFYKAQPELKEYKIIIDNIQRLKAHTLTEGEEKILASFGLT
ncbi:MAG: oligoendopeptidase F family protein, partial [Chlorobi bacterium]|nr:oligoendopeptidase F family protein [Chlorobiota bacterium]